MATLWVRYVNGEEDGWELHDEIDLEELTKQLHRAVSGPSGMVSFGVKSREGAPGTDYGFVGVRMSAVVAWRVDGLVDPARAAALWAELNPE
jgi:hypothetical protein